MLTSSGFGKRLDIIAAALQPLTHPPRLRVIEPGDWPEADRAAALGDDAAAKADAIARNTGEAVEARDMIVFFDIVPSRQPEEEAH